MRLFLIKSTTFGALMILLAYGLDYMVQEGIKKVNFLDVEKWQEITKGGIDAQVLIVGSSRAIDHFDTRAIEEKLGKSSYNLGIDGITYPVEKLVLDLYLQHNRAPEQLIWSLDYHSFQPDDEFENLDQLTPFRNYSQVKEMLALSGRSWTQFYLPLYRYSLTPTMKLQGLLGYLGLRKREKSLIKGFRPRDKHWNQALFDLRKARNPKGLRQEVQEDIFADFLALNRDLQQQGIQQSWVLSPYYSEYNAMITNRKQLLDQLGQASKMLHIPLLDYSNQAISRDTLNFYNANHLSKQGVERFMREWIGIN